MVRGGDGGMGRRREGEGEGEGGVAAVVACRSDRRTLRSWRRLVDRNDRLSSATPRPVVVVMATVMALAKVKWRRR